MDNSNFSSEQHNEETPALNSENTNPGSANPGADTPRNFVPRPNRNNRSRNNPGRKHRGRSGQRQDQNRSAGGQGSQGQGQRVSRDNNRRGGAPFSGPMDHSYRQNGQGGAAGNHAGGGRGSNQRFAGRGRFRQFGKNRSTGTQTQSFAPRQFQQVVEPIPFREDAATRIFAFVDDLFFMTKIMDTGKKLNVKVGFVKTLDDVLERIDANSDEKPSLIIFDLNNANAKPLTIIPKLKSKLKKGTSILGFVSHVQGELKLKAQEAGCDTVMPRSAFSQNLPQLLRRHGAPEELEQE